MRAALTMTAPLARRFADNRVVRTSAWVLLAVAAVALLGPVLSPHSYQAADFDARLVPPSLDGLRLFGTDDLGRDLFVRTMKGAQVTLLVAVVASLVSLVIGVLYGAVAGFVGGRVDAVMMRLVDALYALPFIFFVILLMVVFEETSCSSSSPSAPSTGSTWRASCAGRRCR
ncbi:MAG: hypothetical protein U5K76_14295 [Woeseiaceae bacterium]|nr:hypothetical protein [Woeseiaceae bacterium]